MECDVEKHLQGQTRRISHQYGLRTGRVCMFLMKCFIFVFFFPKSDSTLNIRKNSKWIMSNGELNGIDK